MEIEDVMEWMQLADDDLDSANNAVETIRNIKPIVEIIKINDEFCEGIEAGLADIRNGRVISENEMLARMDRALGRR